MAALAEQGCGVVSGCESRPSLGFREGIAEGLEGVKRWTECAVGHHIAGPLIKLAWMANLALLRIGKISHL